MYTMDVFNDTKGTTITLLLLLNSCEKRLSVDGKDMLTALEPMLQNFATRFPETMGERYQHCSIYVKYNEGYIGLYIIGSSISYMSLYIYVIP